MALINPPHYSLESTESRQWTATQEKTIATDFPFDLQQETVDQFITRTYLQFLWLPEVMNQVSSAGSLSWHFCLVYCTSTTFSTILTPRFGCSFVQSIPPYSLHSLLDPLLQTTRTITNKFHVELLQILQDGGGAGEIEEGMMWYALQHEKVDGREASDHVENGALEPWMDDTWRQNWLERLEKRECVFSCQIPHGMYQSLIRVQIQILLYMTKLWPRRQNL